jgi:hypothetical protein
LLIDFAGAAPAPVVVEAAGAGVEVAGVVAAAVLPAVVPVGRGSVAGTAVAGPSVEGGEPNPLGVDVDEPGTEVVVPVAGDVPTPEVGDSVVEVLGVGDVVVGAGVDVVVVPVTWVWAHNATAVLPSNARFCPPSSAVTIHDPLDAPGSSVITWTP